MTSRSCYSPSIPSDIFFLFFSLPCFSLVFLKLQSCSVLRFCVSLPWFQLITILSGFYAPNFQFVWVISSVVPFLFLLWTSDFFTTFVSTLLSSSIDFGRWRFYFNVSLTHNWTLVHESLDRPNSRALTFRRVYTSAFQEDYRSSRSQCNSILGSILNAWDNPGIIHVIPNTDQLGQFMSHALVGLGGKCLQSHFID